MTTGAAWNVDDPFKPWARFDKDAIREIPFDWTEWLTDIGSTYASHTIIVATGLECTTSVQASGVITATIQKASAAALTLGTKYAVTVYLAPRVLTQLAVEGTVVRGVNAEVQRRNIPQTYTAAGRQAQPGRANMTPLVMSRSL